jgi:hypothetical protein
VDGYKLCRKTRYAFRADNRKYFSSDDHYAFNPDYLLSLDDNSNNILTKACDPETNSSAKENRTFKKAASLI